MGRSYSLNNHTSVLLLVVNQSNHTMQSSGLPIVFWLATTLLCFVDALPTLPALDIPGTLALSLGQAERATVTSQSHERSRESAKPDASQASPPSDDSKIIIPLAASAGCFVILVIMGLAYFSRRRQRPSLDAKVKRESAKSYAELWKRARSSVLEKHPSRRQSGTSSGEAAPPRAALLVTANE